MNKNSDLTERLTAVYKRSGMTKTEFANRIGISRQQLSNLLNGKQLPSISTVMNICKAFSVMKEWLMNGKGSMEWEIKQIAEENELQKWDTNERIRMISEKIEKIESRLSKLEAKK
jgi:transcriptional regulator with XRE-family HTH domain